MPVLVSTRRPLIIRATISGRTLLLAAAFAGAVLALGRVRAQAPGAGGGPGARGVAGTPGARRGALGCARGGGGRVCWAELPPPASPGLEFVPPAGSVARIFLREASGRVRTVGEWPAGPGLGQGPGKPLPVRALGLLGPDLCLQVNRVVTTEFL